MTEAYEPENFSTLTPRKEPAVKIENSPQFGENNDEDDDLMKWLKGTSSVMPMDLTGHFNTVALEESGPSLPGKGGGSSGKKPTEGAGPNPPDDQQPPDDSEARFKARKNLPFVPKLFKMANKRTQPIRSKPSAASVSNRAVRLWSALR